MLEEKEMPWPLTSRILQLCGVGVSIGFIRFSHMLLKSLQVYFSI